MGNSVYRRYSTGQIKSCSTGQYSRHHVRIMDLLGKWASESGVPLVDIIKMLDNARDVLVSWVHLTPCGNKFIAEAFANEISARLTDKKGWAQENLQYQSKAFVH